MRGKFTLADSMNMERAAFTEPFALNRYTNAAEDLFCREADARGWLRTKRGWPDFFCVASDGKPVAVEVKKWTRDGRPQLLRSEQALVMAELQKLGVRCYVAHQSTNGTLTLERFEFSKHAPARAKAFVAKPTNIKVGESTAARSQNVS